MYCVIGCCDPGDEHYEVARTADDYLWLKLSFIRTRANDESDAFSYSNLQKLILEEYGNFYYIIIIIISLYLLLLNFKQVFFTFNFCVTSSFLVLLH